MSDNKLDIKMYDVVKTFLQKAPILNKEQINELIININNFEKKCNNRFYMLLCRDINYYTVFEKNCVINTSLGKEVIDCVKNIGNIIDFEVINEKESIELWIRTKENSEPFVAYLFPYDLGLVKFGG